MSTELIRSTPGEDAAGRTPVQRVLEPETIAIVGLGPTSGLIRFIEPTLHTNARLFFVHPKYDEVLGHRSYRSVSEIGAPLDVVFSAMSAERTVDLAEECADLDCGGMVIYAAGFAEVGDEQGAALQRRLISAAERGKMAIVGPNSLGYVNVPRNIRLTAATDYHPRPGGISIVTHSGMMLGGLAQAASIRRGVGLNHLISSGNEAVTDMADYLSYLADDPATTAIGLVVEAIRRPQEFFSAARRARDAGKPIVALKLARNSRTRAMAASHTGALAGDAWVYDLAFQQAGIALAADIEDLIDRLSIVTQIDPARWTGVENLGVVAGTGGFASLAFDVAEQEGVHMPELESMKQWVTDNIPGVGVPNPLDTTGFGATYWSEIVRRYIASDDLDALLFINMWGDNDDTPINRWLIEEILKAARDYAKPVAISGSSGAIGDFATEIIGDTRAIALGYGIRPTIRGLAALGDVARDQANRRRPRAERGAARNRPLDVVRTPQGATILGWQAATQLLSDFGVPVSPYVLVGPADPDPAPPFAGPYVVKIAELAHRSEHGGVTVGVDGVDLAAAINRLRGVAVDLGVPAMIAIQPMADIEGELLLGIENQNELGPAVVLGLGGVLVEVLDKIGGRIAPVTVDDARALIEEFRSVKFLHGFRGKPAWDLDTLAQILVGLGQLASACSSWMASLDVNPLIFGAHGYVAVDVLCTLKD